MELDKKKKPYLIFFLAVLLSIYPLRHVALGVDIWDTGYNYANFQYSGLEYMDSMWFFATWLANEIGSILTVLPYGNTVVGLNVYTSLLISLMAVGTFLFCVYRCQFPVWIAFAGEVIACALCWAPSAMLYTYLTYLFLLGASMCLYLGLYKHRQGYLIAAGIILGLNVGVRFSNLAQVGLILLVWSYAFIAKSTRNQVLKETGSCVLGYVLGFGSFLLLMWIRYGLFTYWKGVLRLFQMTEVATDYSPARMLFGVVQAYFDCSYWLKRFGLTLVICGIVCAVLPKRLRFVQRHFTIVSTLVLFYWLSRNGFYVKDYTIYQAIYYPCVAMFALAFVVCICFLVKRESSKEDKLKALFVLVLILIGTVGSNNAMYSGINNTFLLLPFLFYITWKFCREEKKMIFFPLKCLLALAIGIVTVQAVGFGHTFSYEEATGGRNMNTEITGVPVLSGMTTSPKKAENLMDLYQYLEDNNLRDRECILFGHIPGIAYYMQLTPAMNIWSDLRSYDCEVMIDDLNKIKEKMQNSKKYPLLIMETSWAQYMNGERQDAIFMDDTALQKLQIIIDFMDRFQYHEVYANEKYVIFIEKSL